MKFLDFCSGVGTARMALESLGHTCVGHSEIDDKAEYTYNCFFDKKTKNWGDLMNIEPQELPDFDLMVAGFPCQPFSIVGNRKGMHDERGQIIHGLCRILADKKPKFFLLENVKGLVSHNGGRTLAEVLRLLREAGYEVKHQVIKSTQQGVAQLRERIYFVGRRTDLVDTPFDFQFPAPTETGKPLTSYLTDEDPNLVLQGKGMETFRRYLRNSYNMREYSVADLQEMEGAMLDTRQSDLRIFEEHCPTLRTGRHGILYVRNGVIRKLSGREAMSLQGVSEDYLDKLEGISQTALLSQAGNAMTVDVITNIAKHIA